ncbi:IS110 family transposase [Levilactobacillus zymae]|uniref:IS110 family transposase n=3 Tax=Levilactobacillus zymae TaxID=267363 RepID=A0ABQ0X0G6_9LACO|nr:IS110 family transposase [Levilactobacillus zymae]QFR60406.1 IS110 family transposase [Levilactobacillus zymae]QFR60407.1 IS110 family transposase [Levilactobacillus zymae]QFR60542.1 IS110 family transposase [Levilactobacillus zymae]QFR60575.1 IS110 family transposase [Levilactobacillus zymae]QFR60938.1 IS110 family transposase [Levilactobacillus zymae]
MIMRTIIGIDVSKNKANIAVATDLVVVKELAISLDALGFNELKHVVLQFGGNPEIVFEATGVYSRRLEYFLQQDGLNYHILNPLAAKNRITTGSRLRKNDERDARRLAITEFTEQLEPYLLAYKQDPIYRELTDMNRYYDQLNEDKKRARNRAHRVLQLVFASFGASKDGFDLDTKLSWELLTLFPHAQIIREIGDLNELENRILAAHFKGIGPKRAHDAARKLWKLAAKNGDAVSLSSDNTRQMKVLAEQVLALETAQDQQVLRMTALGKSLPEYELLQTIPGIGSSTAIRLISELGDIRRFNTRQQLNSYVGIDMTEVDSGDHQSARHITKHGNPHARRILYWTVILMINPKMGNNHIRDAYEKRREASSSKKKLIVRQMDRLIKTILYLIKTNQPYSYELAPQSK